MNNKTVIGISTVVVIILIATVAYIMTQPSDGNNKAADNTTIDSQDAPASVDGLENADMPAVAITYTDSGFEPLQLTVKKGTTITVTNSSSMDLMFASADHPAHRENSELNIATIKPGKSGTVTINQTGAWGYHDHNNADHTGKVIVTE